ncbi:hydantoinase/carbamoylase family amidase [Rhizobium leguminosarum]|nr:hydantoinase/carbamoylase family amidase [Rhizobium leguminosarum]
MMNAVLLERPASLDLGDLAAQLFSEIAMFTADIEGVSRPAFSDIETETLEFLIDFARSEGLGATWDAGRNVVFSLPQDEQADRYILVGSHVDSVPRGGNYDGLAGVLAGLLSLVRARREGIRFAEPVKVIAMRGEESAWFGPCYVGSKALLGLLSKTELGALHKKDGLTLDAHMEAIGIDMADIRAGKPLLNRSAVNAYIEIHIEQGPVLVKRNLPTAIVSGIRGNFRYKKISCFGEEGHSGAVPLAYRHDPVLAMAELLNVLDAAWHDFVAEGRDLVVTSGMVSTDQQKHALSRIPDSVEFSLDVRSQDTDMLKIMDALVRKHVERIEKERNVRFDLGEVLWTTPALCSKPLIGQLIGAVEALGLEPALISSGGGHDAAVFSEAGIPSGMIFIRNRNGSHNPQEAMDIDDFKTATSVLFQFLSNTHPVAHHQGLIGQTAKEPGPMFTEITEIIRQKGNAIHAYRAAAAAAQEAAIANPDCAAGYFMLGVAAWEFADAHYGEALHANFFDQELSRFERYTNVLEAAFSNGDDTARLRALSEVAQSMARQHQGSEKIDSGVNHTD